MRALFCSQAGKTVFADIYQYQDANGNWVFTDTPPVHDTAEVTKMDGMIETQSALRDLQKLLTDQYRPENGVDAAAMATVTVTTPVGNRFRVYFRHRPSSDQPACDLWG
ncbi:MAG: DUF4124 domain-containing protein [Desulfobacterales bacterium]